MECTRTTLPVRLTPSQKKHKINKPSRFFERPSPTELTIRAAERAVLAEGEVPVQQLHGARTAADNKLILV